ncbi:Hypothetical predicted protein [Cloeon dipterum]|uniref:SBF1/SBF2 domain-containing protein n=1 Tax=Cloeon dipterum TaxID=197152 RepID=A0A8S1CB01_9INSE|nr:Hypothetical predicted protein [Cloeon dipterum]
MVEVPSRREELLQGLMDKTRSGLQSVLRPSTSRTRIFNGLSSRLESALSIRSNSSDLQTPCEEKPQIDVSTENPEKEIRVNSPNGSIVASGADPFERLTYKIDAQSSGSDNDGYGPSTLSVESDKKQYIQSGSEGSIQSWASSLSLDSQTDEATVEAIEFMKIFVATLFSDSNSINRDQKAAFGKFAQDEPGRLWFARFVNAQRAQHKRVPESTFFSLAQYFAIILFECADSDDFGPAKTLMNMCFTFYYESKGPPPMRQYIFTVLKDQPIFHSLRFWNAAFFEALQGERSVRPVATREDVLNNQMEAITDERAYQENITFGQLGTFTSNMHAFGLTKDMCMEFLRKQCTIASLSEEQEKMLRDNLDDLYVTEPTCQPTPTKSLWHS